MSNLDIEAIRKEFEAWYIKQKREQHAVWHPASTLDFDSKNYPHGRYTIFSAKQSAWEVWLASKLYTPVEEDVQAPVAAITIALDYDGTYTRDPDFWLAVIKLAQSRGHSVLVATMRTFEETQGMCDRLTDLVHQIVPTARAAKMPFLLKYGINPHIWIDDQPHFLLMDALSIEKEQEG